MKWPSFANGISGLFVEGGLVAALAAGIGMWGLSRAIDALETPARGLSWAEAAEIVREAAKDGKVEIVREDGKLFSIRPRINGVDLYYMTEAGSSQRAVERIDPRLLVLLLRMTEWDPSLVEIHHLGIYPGHNPADAEETHNRGTAIDLRKFVFRDGMSLDVLLDWGNKRAWIGHYRLGLQDLGADWFADAYDFLASQATDRPLDGCGFSGENASSAPEIGDRSFLITPDHGDRTLAASHKNHFHVQVGPTRACGGRSARSW